MLFSLLVTFSLHPSPLFCHVFLLLLLKEPWIAEYVSMDLEQTLAQCGFRDIGVLENSPRHRTVVAYK